MYKEFNDYYPENEMTDKECKDLIERMEIEGWKCDKNDENTLGFIKSVDENYEGIRDYDKKTSRFVQFNGKQKINLRVSNE